MAEALQLEVRDGIDLSPILDRSQHALADQDLAVHPVAAPDSREARMTELPMAA